MYYIYRSPGKAIVRKWLKRIRRRKTKGLSKNYVAKNEGVKSTRFSSLADTIFPVNRLSESSVGGNDFSVFGRRK